MVGATVAVLQVGKGKAHRAALHAATGGAAAPHQNPSSLSFPGTACSLASVGKECAMEPYGCVHDVT